MALEISVFLENRITHFERVTNILKTEKINIRSLMLNSIYQGWAVINLLVDEPHKAYEILSKNGNSVVLREVIALEMKDESGGLDELLIKISRAGIHFESAYSRLIKENNMSILILEVRDFLESKGKLEANGIRILDDSVVYGK
jgi:hypothetical protein